MNIDFDDADLYSALLQICSRYGIDPSASVETEAYFRQFIRLYDREANIVSFKLWLEEELPKHFRSLRESPRWLQEPEWPIIKGVPLFFAGQLDFLMSDDGIITRIFHDDTSIYVFIGEKIPPIVIVQQT